MLQMRRSRIMLTLLHAYSTSVEALDDLGHNIMSNGWSRLSSLGRGGALVVLLWLLETHARTLVCSVETDHHSKCVAQRL
jgi:hypothetical protein